METEIGKKVIIRPAGKIFLFVILFSLIYCDSADEEVTFVEPVITREKFIPLLVDLQILEAHYNKTYGREDIYFKALDSASQHVFEAHGVTKKEYEEAIQIYASSIDTAYKVYEAALDTVTIRLGE